MRDVFFQRVFELAKEDEKIIVVSADMGCPSLDQFQRAFPHRYISTGIAEQQTILVASGLASLGFKVYCYAIAPFITLRCYEQIRVNCGMMKYPLVIVGVGGGFGYEDSGATHHLLEDIAVMKAIPDMDIFIPPDNNTAKMFAGLSYKDKKPCYIRLDRAEEEKDYETRWEENTIFTTGSMWKVAKEVAEELPELKLGYESILLINNDFRSLEEKDKGKIFTVEEGFEGGLYASVKEVYPQAINLGIKSSQGYCYKYGGREEIRKYYGIDKESLKEKIRDYCKT
jgi:transketolase